MTLWNLDSFSSYLRWCGPLQLAFMGDVIYTCTNIHLIAQEEEKEEEGEEVHILTHDAMQGCGLTSLVVCINEKICDIREGHVTTRSEF